jgi:hypothetical protein
MEHHIKHVRHFILGSERMVLSFQCSCGLAGPRRQRKRTEMMEECRERVAADAWKHLRDVEKHQEEGK